MNSSEAYCPPSLEKNFSLSLRAAKIYNSLQLYQWAKISFRHRYIKLGVVKTKMQSVLLTVEFMCCAFQTYAIFFFYNDLHSKFFLHVINYKC